MTYENLGGGALDYYPCRYGKSKLLFRGPKRKLDQPYVAVIGGTETYGKFIERPYPAMLEEAFGCSFVNLGCVNAGLDVFSNDQSIMDICRGADVTVVQITGAQNLSNRFYAVHPRRNDRFLRASNLLKTIYRGVEFTDINFTRHLLKVLWEASPDKFSMVEAELKEAWTGRMKRLVSRLEGKVVLLWLADHAPDHAPSFAPDNPDPLFIDRDMLEQLRPFVSDIAEVVVSPEEIAEGRAGLVHGEVEAPAAGEMLGSVAQEKAAAALLQVLMPLM
ncbi:MAG TPA: hypothetical protein ENK41_01470 [Rhodobacteraceae bacterium]|nr:hypothetical protein [Paracoccaceae bacterium]